MSESIIIDGLDVTVLHDKILVFHNMLDDPQGLIDYYVDHKDKWVPWYTFGDMHFAQHMPGGSWDHFPTEKEWQEEVIDGISKSKYAEDYPNDKYALEIAKKWHSASQVYKNFTGTDLPEWISSTWSIARYFPDVEPNAPTHTMNYHTDYQQDAIDAPGVQPYVTGVLYPNDDYEGGTIGFRVFSGDLFDAKTFSNVEFETIYKPKAGDLIMFPSIHPFYHGVYHIYKKPKYLFRLYWKVTQKASELYSALERKYGDSWEELEKERKRRGDSMYADDWAQCIRIPFAEYYEKLEAGILPKTLWEHRESDDYREKKIE